MTHFQPPSDPSTPLSPSNLPSTSSPHPPSSLEQYKLLCERRILDLSPHHPLPVQEAYIGVSFEPVHSTHPGETEISVHSAQPGADRELNRVKRVVEDQKTEISALKQALKSSKSSFSASELTSEEAESVHSPVKSERIQILELENDKNTLISIISSLKSELETVKSTGIAAQNPQIATLSGQIETLTAANRTLTQQLSQIKSELASALSQKAYFQSVYDAAKQEAGEKEASEFKAKGEIKELQKALQVLWDGTASAARSAQSRDEQLSGLITALEMEKFDMEMTVLKAKDAQKRAVEDAKSIENEYKMRLKAVESLLETTKNDMKRQIATLETEKNRLKAVVDELKSEKSTEESGKSTEIQRISVLLAKTVAETDEKISALELALKSSQNRANSLEIDLKSAKSALETSQKTIKLLQTDIESLTFQVKSTIPIVVPADISFSDSKDRDFTEKITALEGGIKANFDQLMDFYGKLQSILRVNRKKAVFEHISDLISALFDLIPAIEPLILPDFHSIDPVKSHTSELSSIPDRFLCPESAPKSRSDYDSDQFIEIQSLKQQISLEKQQKTDLNTEFHALSFQLSCAVDELQQYREQIRVYSEENGQFSVENQRLMREIEHLEGEFNGLSGEKARIDRLLRKFLLLVPGSGGVKRLIGEILEVIEGIQETERGKRRIAERVEEIKEEKERQSCYRELQMEKMSLLRTEYEAETLEKRLLQLELELESFSTPSLRYLEPRFESLPASGAISPDFMYEEGRLDEKIAPYLSESVKRRLREGRRREKRFSGTMGKRESRR